MIVFLIKIMPKAKDHGHDSGGGGSCNLASGGCLQSSTSGIAANSPVKYNHLTYQHGHSFVKKTFHKPTNCHYCSELLWGLMGQGYICEGMYYVLVCISISLNL